jgi:IS605 OrfB family transposase
MKLVVQVQLLPDPEQATALRETMERFNEAANWATGELFARGITNKRLAQKVVYRELRDRFDLTAQTAILVIHRVCEALKRDKTKRPVFRKHAAITYDPRVLRFLGLDRVNLWTLAGRLVIPILVGPYQAERMPMAKGQCDLIDRKGKWFLVVTVDVPEGTPVEPTDFLGVDMGLANIAVDSDPDTEPHSGEDVERIRRKHNLQRKRLQRKGTKGAKKKLKRMAGKEARFRKHQNHVVSKAIVGNAKGTGRGIAVEDLSGIRDRLTARGTDARNRLSGWSFGQLYHFLAYKAELAGVPIVTVDPRNTSRTCAQCGHCHRSNRKNQAEFACKACGHRAHADKNAARNIRARALAKRALELDSSMLSRKSHVL